MGGGTETHTEGNEIMRKLDTGQIPVKEWRVEGEGCKPKKITCKEGEGHTEGLCGRGLQGSLHRNLSLTL